MANNNSDGKHASLPTDGGLTLHHLTTMRPMSRQSTTTTPPRPPSPPRALTFPSSRDFLIAVIQQALDIMDDPEDELSQDDERR